MGATPPRRGRTAPRPGHQPVGPSGRPGRPTARDGGRRTSLTTPSLVAIRTFVAVHRAGSMTRAAEALGISQPGATAQIRGLERDLGVTLFTRHGRGLVATPAADELAARVGDAVDALVDAVAAATTDPPDRFARTVLLGGPAELTALRVLPALADLFRAGLRLRVRTGLAENLVADLLAGSLDLVVSTVRPRSGRLVSTPLTDEEFVLVAAPEIARRLPHDVSLPEALATVPTVTYAEELPVIRRYWRHVFGRPPPSTGPAVVVGDLRAVAAATAAEAGYTVLPRYLAAAYVDRGDLTVLHEPADPPINTIHLAWSRAAPLPAAVAAVRDHLHLDAGLW